MKNTFFREEETKDSLIDFIRSANKLSMGEQCLKFEQAFAAWQGSKHAVLVNSGGSANLLLLQSLKNLGRLQNGAKIGFTALTWPTNVTPIIQLGFEPVPIDCEIHTLNSSSATLIQRLDEVNLDAFFITNCLGFCGDLDRIRDLCAQRAIILIEDNCEALGTEYQDRKTGGYGLAASFSFYVAHHLSTIEGGMLITDDDELANMFVMSRASGWDRNLSAAEQTRLRKLHSIQSEFYAKYSFYDLSFNIRPTEITGFLGVKQLAFVDEIISSRQRIFFELEDSLRQNDDFIPVNHDHINSFSPFAIPFLCKSKDLFNRYTGIFSAADIEIRPIIAGNIQRQPFYEKYARTSFNLPNTEFIHDCGFYAGNYPELNRSDIAAFKRCMQK